MDLSLIKRKLDTGQYTDPWQYVDDVFLMFDNAWLYNRKSSKVHKNCSKVCHIKLSFFKQGFISEFMFTISLVFIGRKSFNCSVNLFF